MNPSTYAEPTIQYIAFDKKTGKILHTHSRFNVEKNEYVEIPDDELKDVFGGDPAILERLTDHEPDNLEILKFQPDQTLLSGESDVMVDVKHKNKIIQRPKLALTVDKQEITGNGEDSAKIDIRAVNDKGDLLRNVEEKIKVTTTRGRLSARAGIVDLVKGRATITLTSVNETVSKVRVRATSLDGICASGAVTLEFV